MVVIGGWGSGGGMLGLEVVKINVRVLLFSATLLVHFSF